MTERLPKCGVILITYRSDTRDRRPCSCQIRWGTSEVHRAVRLARGFAEVSVFGGRVMFANPAASWYHSNQYNEKSTCEHCGGVVRHERWCITLRSGGAIRLRSCAQSREADADRSVNPACSGRGVGEESVRGELPHAPDRVIFNGPPLGRRLHLEPLV